MKSGYTAEEAVIGSVLSDSKFSIPKLEGILNPEHFDDYNLGQVYELCLKMKREGADVGIISVLAKVNSSFGPKLVDICEGFPGVRNVDSYRDLVIRNYHERRLKQQMKIASNEITEESIKSIEKEWHGLQSLGVRNFDSSEKMIGYLDVLNKRSKGGETLFPTGFQTLDYRVPLLKRGELCVVGARTSQGKTSLLLGMALKMVDAGLRVVFCSGEMSFYQLMDRIVAVKTSIPLMNIRKGQLDKDNWVSITSEVSKMAETKNMRFIEASSLTIQKIMPDVVSFRPDVLLVDYIQRFTPHGKMDSRASFFSDIANFFKGLSVERDMVVVAASQLGRGVEQRNGDPILSDLKETGGLEESADVVWMLKQEKEETFDDLKRYRMLILKNRNGPTFEFPAIFNTKTATFHETE